MNCTRAETALLIEYIERQLDAKMKKLGLDKNTRDQILIEIEKIKETLIEYGLDEIRRELGI